MSKSNHLNGQLSTIKKQVYEPCGLQTSHFETEAESQDYLACRFELNGLKIICRNARITPKKTGQFVTFWKRDGNGPIQPFEQSDGFDFFVVNVKTEKDLGQFVFPKSILLKKGIISTDSKEGKRAFRVYPPWDLAQSKQAKRTQTWQKPYFLPVNDAIDLERAKKLYGQKAIPDR